MSISIWEEYHFFIPIMGMNGNIPMGYGSGGGDNRKKKGIMMKVYWYKYKEVKRKR